jgi:hypothetical protein
MATTLEAAAGQLCHRIRPKLSVVLRRRPVSIGQLFLWHSSACLATCLTLAHLPPRSHRSCCRAAA